MKKIVTVLGLALALTATDAANAAGKSLKTKAPLPSPKEVLEQPRCSADNCVKVVLSSRKGAAGSLRVWQKGAGGTYVKSDIGCWAMGGNPTAHNDEAIYSPDGVHRVKDKSRYLRYKGSNGTTDRSNYEWASYFFNPGPGKDQVAIHTGSKGNSHGCVRAPCAKAVHDLEGSTEVDIAYKD